MELIVIKKFDQPEINNDSKICLIKVLTAGEEKITLNTIIFLKQEKKKIIIRQTQYTLAKKTKDKLNMLIRGIYNYTMSCITHNLHPGGRRFHKGRKTCYLKTLTHHIDPHGDFLLFDYIHLEKEK
jgi:hypothetical protein